MNFIEKTKKKKLDFCWYPKSWYFDFQKSFCYSVTGSNTINFDAAGPTMYTIKRILFTNLVKN